MKRLLWAVAGTACVAGVASADPPAGGKERTLLEQEFFLTEQPSPTATSRGVLRNTDAPVSVATTMRFVQQWVLVSACGRLDVTRERRQVW